MKMVLVAKDILPFGVKAVCCGKTAKAGQWVGHKEIPGVMHVVTHRSCMIDIANEVSEDTIGSDVTQAQLDASKTELMSMIGEME